MSNSRRDFLKKIAAGGLAATSAPVLAAGLKNEQQGPELPPQIVDIKRRLNVIWITCDEMNTKAMSVYGNPLTTMPGAERMAKEGTMFNHAYVQMPKCVPSRVIMMTARYAHTEGHRTLTGRKYYIPNKDVPKNNDFTLRADEPNMVKLMKDNGYKTCLLGKNHLVDWNLHKVWFDMTSRWDSPEWKNRPDEFEITDNPDLRKMYFKGKIKDDYDYSMLPDSLCVSWTKEFLNTYKDEPFFALVDIGLPHPPYAEYTKMPSYKIPLDRIPAPKVQPLDAVPSVEQCKRKSFDLEHVTDIDRKRIRRAYYTAVEFADSKVKEILDEVDRLGLSDNTLVIYSADHGDSNGERNCFEKWDTFFYDEITRVPLIMRLPGSIPAGKKLENLVEFVDIVPTIMELMGIEIPVWVQGKSLLPLIEGKTTEHKDAVFSQGGVEKDATLRPDPKIHSQKQQVVVDFPESMIRSKMIRTDRYKYVYRLEGDHELFDMKNDPDELTNLAYNPEYREIVNELMQRMLKFTIEQETNYPIIDKLIC